MPGRIDRKKTKKVETKSIKSPSSFSLASAKDKLDPALASLFASSNGPVKAPVRINVVEDPEKHEDEDLDAIPTHESLLEAEDDGQDTDDSAESDDEELSDGSEEFSDPSDIEVDEEEEQSGEEPREEPRIDASASEKRKRKRNGVDDNLEGAYFEKLAREEARDEQASKRQKQEKGASPSKDVPETETGVPEDDRIADDTSDISMPLHETLAPGKTDVEVEKASRTVFLANVSTEAITSKSAKKILLNHLASFIPHLSVSDAKEPGSKPKKQAIAHKVESIRFRSTAFSTTIPKKAAFAKREIMDETSRSTNAYAVYSTKLAAREAAVRLNGTVVLGRHLRVDSVAHPAKIDHRRCVFVGNLGFIDDETNMRAVQKAQGDNAVRKPQNGDVEEGLWVQFSKAGKVESIRVVRDSKTRVGKGIAYVQFVDQNGVEAALLFDGKKYPPLLPRKLRVSRAKKNTGPKPTEATANGSARNGLKKQQQHAKADPERQSLQGRASKLLGRAGAAGVKSSSRNGHRPMKTPESFVFEGHRAKSSQGNAGLRLGKGSGKKKDGRPRSRSAKRGAEWKKKKASK